ncbi:MAG: HD domain-containing phosphohydrolase [Thermodesulfobacteriota bacterium]
MLYRNVKADTFYDFSKARILAVDDDMAVCRIIAEWLKREGFHCETASSVDDAIRQLNRSSYDLIISDVVMPIKTGIDLLNHVKEKFPMTAVIMNTGVDDRDTAYQAISLGAFGCMQKPQQKNEFLVNVMNALERRHLILDHYNYEHRLESEVRARTEEIRLREEEIALRLVSASGYRDEETGRHLKRIGLFATRLAGGWGWPDEKVDQIRVAAPMHDVGKIGIPDEILFKPGKLTESEFDIMKKHTLIGGQILGNSEIPLLRMAHDIAMQHHERWDGSGYPRQLRGDTIREPAQIVAIVDVFDALSNDRIYRSALPADAVLSLMKNGAGSHFNPLLTECFLDHLPAMQDILQEYGDQ